MRFYMEFSFVYGKRKNFLRFFNYFNLFVGFLLRTCATNYIWSYQDSSSSETRAKHAIGVI